MFSPYPGQITSTWSCNFFNDRRSRIALIYSGLKVGGGGGGGGPKG